MVFSKALTGSLALHGNSNLYHLRRNSGQTRQHVGRADLVVRASGEEDSTSSAPGTPALRPPPQRPVLQPPPPRPVVEGPPAEAPRNFREGNRDQGYGGGGGRGGGRQQNYGGRGYGRGDGQYQNNRQGQLSGGPQQGGYNNQRNGGQGGRGPGGYNNNRGYNNRQEGGPQQGQGGRTYYNNQRYNSNGNNGNGGQAGQQGQFQRPENGSQQGGRGPGQQQQKRWTSQFGATLTGEAPTQAPPENFQNGAPPEGQTGFQNGAPPLQPPQQAGPLAENAAAGSQFPQRPAYPGPPVRPQYPGPPQRPPYPGPQQGYQRNGGRGYPGPQQGYQNQQGRGMQQGDRPANYRDRFGDPSGGNGGYNRPPPPQQQGMNGAGPAMGNQQPGSAPAVDERPQRKFRGRENVKDEIERQRKARANKRTQREERAQANAPVMEDIFEVGEEGMSVAELANKLAVSPGEVIRILFIKGIMSQVNQILDRETIKIVATEFNVDVVDKDPEDVTFSAKKTVEWMSEADMEHLTPRPPVVTVMGHVDHGKTSLLDYIRKSRVAAGEAGGITQAIGAYTCDVKHSGEAQQVTFLDTPGHEAFSAMRARGTRVTDIAVIVVAADDGVKPQTVEAISHAKAAEVPIVVAINKIDKDGANIERVKQELSEAGLLPEEWGGDTPICAISAKKGLGIDELLDTLLLVAEVSELSANPEAAARGTVLEAHLDKRSGAVASVLVANGTLRVGDMVVAGAAYGKVRSLVSQGGDVKVAGPSIAVQLSGLNSVPIAGDEFCVVPSDAEAKKMSSEAELELRMGRLDELAGGTMVTTRSLASMDEDGDTLQRLNVILKADASGTLEAVKAALGALPQDVVQLRYLMAAANEITDSDVDLAFASGATIVGFNVEPTEGVLSSAKRFGIEIRSYKVIYDLVDDMRAAMEGRLGAAREAKELGTATVRAIFGKDNRRVAGVLVDSGSLKKGCMVKVWRGRRKVYEGELTSLRRVKDIVDEVGSGLECGVGVSGWAEWREDDKIESYEVVEKTRTLEDAAAAPTQDFAMLQDSDKQTRDWQRRSR